MLQEILYITIFCTYLLISPATEKKTYKGKRLLALARALRADSTKSYKNRYKMYSVRARERKSLITLIMTLFAILIANSFFILIQATTLFARRCWSVIMGIMRATVRLVAGGWCRVTTPALRTRWQKYRNCGKTPVKITVIQYERVLATSIHVTHLIIILSRTIISQCRQRRF